MSPCLESELDIAVHNNILTISGKKRGGAEERKEGDSFALYRAPVRLVPRSFALPDTADVSASRPTWKTAADPDDLEEGRGEAAQDRAQEVVACASYFHSWR